MIKRPQIRWRVGVILVIGLLAMLSIPLALFYALRGVDEVTGLPQPRQLSAIVTLVEATPHSERPALVAALRSAQMSVRVAPDAQVTTDLEPIWPLTGEEHAAYTAVLEDRAFAAYAVPRSLFGGRSFSPLRAAEIRVALRDGGVLIIASESMTLFTQRGVPHGFGTAFLGVSIAFITLLVLNREFQPVLRLARAVEGLDPTDAEAELPEIRAGTAEVRALIKAFRRQQTQVTTLLRTRAALVGGIQHDVRTFATRLRLRLEKLPDAEERRQAETDIGDLVSLMDSALLATRSEAAALDLELIDFDELVRDEIHGQTEAGLKADLTVEPSDTGFEILGDRVALRRILLNLVENALRYGSAAQVSLSADHAVVTLRVEDNGPGIPEAHRADLLQPFSRLETSRSRQTGGAGLGLSIVQTLVTAHAGAVQIGDAPTGGARVTVTLPKFDPSNVTANT